MYKLTNKVMKLKLKNYEIDGLVGKIVREVNEKKEREFNKRVKRDSGLNKLRKEVDEFEKVMEEMEKKRKKLMERVGRFNRKYDEGGMVSWNSGYGIGCGGVGVSVKLDYRLEERVREEVVLWNMDEGKKVNELVKELVEKFS